MAQTQSAVGRGRWAVGCPLPTLDPFPKRFLGRHSGAPDYYYIADFSSRQKPDHDFDAAAPGSWVVGRFQVNSGQATYYYLGGTSMASPHVAGTVALMAQKNPALTASDAEEILESTAIPIPDGCIGTNCWDFNATGAGLVDAAAVLDEVAAPSVTNVGRNGRNR